MSEIFEEDKIKEIKQQEVSPKRKQKKIQIDYNTSIILLCSSLEIFLVRDI